MYVSISMLWELSQLSILKLLSWVISAIHTAAFTNSGLVLNSGPGDPVRPTTLHILSRFSNTLSSIHGSLSWWAEDLNQIFK